MNVDLHGSCVRTRQIGAFALTLTRYDRAASLPLHEHDQAYVTVVLSGAYRELANGVTRDCVTQSIVVHPSRLHGTRQQCRIPRVAIEGHNDKEFGT